MVGGLRCIDYGDYIRIWNPISGESFDMRTTETEVSDHQSFDIVSHFGFDAVEKKHMVHSLCLHRPTGKISEMRAFVVEDNCWRTGLCDFPPDMTVSEIQRVICIDGVIYYSCNCIDKGACLLAFHVGSKRVEIIPAPEEAQFEYTVLMEFGGLATLGDWYNLELNEGYGNRITLWIPEDAEKQVWRRKTCMIPWPEVYDPSWQMTLDGTTPTD